MRKIAFILLGLMLGWLSGVEASMPAPMPNQGLQLAVDTSSADFLQCAREYNFDLEVPQGVAMPPVRTVVVRTMTAPEYLSVRCGVPDGCGVKVACLYGFHTFLFSAGVGAADCDVCRLRRLRI